MRIILTLLCTTLLIACSSKYSGPHSDANKFSEDVSFCLKKSCKNQNQSFLNNISIIPSLLAYGGGGGGGGGSNSQENNISYSAFNSCLAEKGYKKDENGMFDLPYLTCN